MSPLIALLGVILSAEVTVATTEPCVAQFSANSYGVGLFNETFNHVPYCSFLGVRYAEPPTGSLRFKNPVLYDPEGPHNYFKVGNVCPQDNITVYKIDMMGDEDCLFMDIYSPLVRGENIGESRNPVLVFVHGGSFIEGSAQHELNNGADLLIDSGIVVVSINYRLGILGFLRYPEFNITGNFGLKDQRAALRWVQKYIKYFGGDPQRVTLMGHDAGGASVTHHLYADKSRGLFQQLFVLEGSLLAPVALDYVYRKEPKACVKPGEMLEQMDARDCFKGWSMDFVSYSSLVYYKTLPTVEDEDDPDPFLTIPPHDQVLSYNNNSDIPILIEQTSSGHEQRLSYTTSFTVGDNLPHVEQLPISKIEKFVALKEFISKKEKSDDFYRKLTNTANDFYPVKRLLRHLVENNRSPVYYLRFEYDGQFGYYKHNIYKSQIKEPKYGAINGDELSYIFTPYVIRNALERKEDFLQEWKIHEGTVELVANFVKHGNPTPKASKLTNVLWPPYNSSHKQYLNIDKTFEIRTDSDSEDDMIVMWELIYDCLYYSKCDEITRKIDCLESIKNCKVESCKDKNC